MTNTRDENIMVKTDLTALGLPTTLDGVPRDPDVAVAALTKKLMECFSSIYDADGFILCDIYQLSKTAQFLFVAGRRSEYFLDLRISWMEFLDNPIELLENASEFHSLLLTMDREIERSIGRKRLEKIESYFDGNAIAPEFSLNSDEKKRVFKLCAEMREIVASSDYFSSNHKKRLLDRISQIEKEIEQNEGVFDVILAGIADFGDALGHFGDKAKPLFDRMRELREIAQARTSEYKGLPSPRETKRLPPPNAQDNRGRKH